MYKTYSLQRVCNAVKNINGEKMKQHLYAILLTIIALDLPKVAEAKPDLSEVLPSSIYTDRSPSPQPLRWTIFAETIFFHCNGTAKQPLVERVPGIVSFGNIPTTFGTPALNSSDLRYHFSPGLKLGATCRIDSHYSLESSFLLNRGWHVTRSIGPDNPLNWLVMRAPGLFFQTQDFAYQSMAWHHTTKLYTAELNMRYKVSDWITVLAGFRWLQLNENLQGSTPPPDHIQPIWKFNPKNNLFDVARIEKLPGLPARVFPPFWNTHTKNNLYGPQIGIDGKLFTYKCFSIEGLIKAGVYLNHAQESTGVSLEKIVHPTRASTNHIAFIGEADLPCKYQVTNNLAIRLSYKALWLVGVALAPGQIQKTYESGPFTVTAIGVNARSCMLFHGVTAGLEFLF
jgi:hypothetical protein